MITMLEKMARAIWPKLAEANDFHGNGIGTFEQARASDCYTVEYAYEAARAALLAIREPDEAVTSAMGDGPFPPWSDLNYNFTDDERLIVWKSGLDAILNEKPT